MDISPDGQRIVIGGVGAATPTVALMELSNGKILDLALPPNDPTGNVGAFWASAFAPSGRRVAFGGDGSVWIWELDSHTFHRLGKPDSDASFDTVRLLRFTDEDHLLSLVEDGRLLRWTIGAATPDLVMDLKFPVFRAEISSDGRWLAAAAKGPLVTIRSLVNDQFLDIKLKGFENFRPGRKDGEYANALAFDPKSNRLAVAVGSLVPGTEFAVDADDRIVIYDLGQNPPAASDRLPHHYRADRLTFSPDGGFLAAAGGDNQEVTLWDLAHAAEPASVLRGAGSCLWDVAFSADGQSFGFRDERDPRSADPNARGRGPWRGFDSAHRQWLTDDEFTKSAPVARQTSLGGWSIEPDADPHFLWAVHASGVRNRVAINGDLYGKPRCWTFLPPLGEGKPTRLAVGHYWGFSVFELDPRKQDAKRTRLCIGHQGEVTALGPSADGKKMISCSNDMTLAFWDLTKEWPHLGAKFTPKGDRLIVETVEAGGPAWEAGLTVGDEIVRFAVGTEWIDGGPAAWLNRLDDPEPGAPQQFDVIRDGRDVTANGKAPLVTSGKQRPLWRFFPAGGDEWVLWMWRDNFYDSSTKGDYAVGWDVNAADPKDSPAFYRVEQFRRYFHRPDIINKLLQSGDATQALGLLARTPCRCISTTWNRRPRL